MKFPRRLPHFRSFKFAPFALISLFVFSNLTGFLFSRVMAPVVAASPDAFHIPADIPTSGDPQLDRIIYEVGEHQGIDPRFIHAVIWQESRYDQHAKSHAGAQGLMANTIQFVYELQKAGKQFELMLYPKSRHADLAGRIETPQTPDANQQASQMVSYLH